MSSTPNPDATALGAVIRSLRQRRGLSVSQLARLTGVDKGHVSRIETGNKTVSPATLKQIAASLDVSVAEILGETTPLDAITISRTGPEGAGLSATDGRMRMLIPPGAGSRMSSFLLAPGREMRARNAIHPGDELLYVLAGDIELRFEGHVIQLGHGDCVSFPGHLRHNIRALGEAEPLVLIIIDQEPHADQG